MTRFGLATPNSLPTIPYTSQQCASWQPLFRHT